MPLGLPLGLFFFHPSSPHAIHDVLHKSHVVYFLIFLVENFLFARKLEFLRWKVNIYTVVVLVDISNGDYLDYLIHSFMLKLKTQ